MSNIGKIKRVKLWQLVYTLNTIDYTIEQSAMYFLSVYNNVRENRDVFLDMIFTRDSKLKFVVKKDDIESVKDWMEGIPVWEYKSATEVEKLVIQQNDYYSDECILLQETVDIEEL